VVLVVALDVLGVVVAVVVAVVVVELLVLAVAVVVVLVLDVAVVAVDVLGVLVVAELNGTGDAVAAVWLPRPAPQTSSLPWQSPGLPPPPPQAARNPAKVPATAHRRPKRLSFVFIRA
jgi:hypothetical protein